MAGYETDQTRYPLFIFFLPWSSPNNYQILSRLLEKKREKEKNGEIDLGGWLVYFLSRYPVTPNTVFVRCIHKGKIQTLISRYVFLKDKI